MLVFDETKSQLKIKKNTMSDIVIHTTEKWEILTKSGGGKPP